jgi:hypothetical protein
MGIRIPKGTAHGTNASGDRARSGNPADGVLDSPKCTSSVCGALFPQLMLALEIVGLACEERRFQEMMQLQKQFWV